MQVLGNLFWHRRLPVDFTDKYYCSASNPSIIYDEKSGLFLLNVRNTNYKLRKNRKGATECTPVKAAKDIFETRNFITVCRNPMEDSLQWYLIKEKKRQYYSKKHGFEDARLVNWHNRLFLSATIRDYNTGGMGRITLVELDKHYEEVNHYILEGTCGDTSFCEKNYICVNNKPFHYIVSVEPTVVNRYSLSDLRATYLKGTTGMCIGTNMLGAFRGSSQAIELPNGDYLAVIHNSEADENTQHHYYHYFAIWDKDFNLKRISQPYKFEGEPVEFCCGACLKDGFVYITYSVMDSNASIMRIPLEDVLSL